MIDSTKETVVFTTIETLCQLITKEHPVHPLFHAMRFEDYPSVILKERIRMINNFYVIVLKVDCPCKVKYGRSQYDYDAGVMSFFAPRQVIHVDAGPMSPPSGWLICVHADFLRKTLLHEKIQSYNFFEYELNEALLLSETEQDEIFGVFAQIQKESKALRDDHPQDVIVMLLGLLLAYTDRYYQRQFHTRNDNNHRLIARIRNLVNVYIENASENEGPPTPSYLAAQLNLSPKYLSDCLKASCGLTTQELIHDQLIDCAKDFLATTEFSASEIAYKLGFFYPQSFTKMFKQKTKLTPIQYRRDLG